MAHEVPETTTAFRDAENLYIIDVDGVPTGAIAVAFGGETWDAPRIIARGRHNNPRTARTYELDDVMAANIPWYDDNDADGRDPGDDRVTVKEGDYDDTVFIEGVARGMVFVDYMEEITRLGVNVTPDGDVDVMLSLPEE